VIEKVRLRGQADEAQSAGANQAANKAEGIGFQSGLGVKQRDVGFLPEQVAELFGVLGNGLRVRTGFANEQALPVGTN
jgi:hypothetical protein